MLISQCLYYNALNSRKAAAQLEAALDAAAAAADESDEDEPLLAARRRRSSSSVGLPGSHRHHSIRHAESGLEPLTRIITGEDDAPDSNPWLHNTFSVLAVWAFGTAAYFVSYRLGGWDDGQPASAAPGGDGGELLLQSPPIGVVVGMSLGYFSALCYLCARIPQIVKNYREKSCDGKTTHTHPTSLSLAAELTGERARRPRAALLPVVAHGELDLRRQPPGLLPGGRRPAHGPALAAGVARHHGRGLRHLRPVPPVRPSREAAAGKGARRPRPPRRRLRQQPRLRSGVGPADSASGVADIGVADIGVADIGAYTEGTS